MWISPPTKGFPPTKGRKEKLENLKTGEVGKVTTKTPTHSPPKNNIIPNNTNNNIKTKNLKRKFTTNQRKTVNLKEASINILSTNADGLKHKAEDLKNKVRYFDSAIFAVQETHFRRKGTFKLQNYHIFEAIRKNKEQGGTMLGIHVGLQPVLIKEYSEDFELLIVQITAADKEVMVITGYGPQEHWQDHERLPFFTAVEEAVASAEYEGKSVLIAMDGNSKLGPHHIPGDPHEISKNGKVLEGIIERHGLCVINGLLEKRI